jgi:hypothetical protein
MTRCDAQYDTHIVCSQRQQIPQGKRSKACRVHPDNERSNIVLAVGERDGSGATSNFAESPAPWGENGCGWKPTSAPLPPDHARTTQLHRAGASNGEIKPLTQLGFGSVTSSLMP